MTNKPFSGLTIHKVDSITGKEIYGVSFLLYDSTQKPIDQVTTDQNGYIYLDILEISGKIFVREMENNTFRSWPAPTLSSSIQHGCSRYQLKDGDVVEWVYTCTLGKDVDGSRAIGG